MGKQCVGRLLAILALKEPEKPDGFLVEFDVITVVNGHDSTDGSAISIRDERLDIGVLMEWMLVPVEHRLDVAEQGSDPVRIIRVDAIRKTQEVFERPFVPG
jgi:hypothetical protein